jgi:hypothetical protein
MGMGICGVALGARARGGGGCWLTAAAVCGAVAVAAWRKGGLVVVARWHVVAIA